MSVPSRHASGEAVRPVRSSQALPGRESCVPATRLRTFAAIVLAAVMAFTLTACGPDRGLKVSPEGSPAPSLFPTDTAKAGPPNEPFSLEEIRKTIVDASGVAVTGSAPETAKVVADCDECLKFATPFHRDDQKFQVATVANPQQRDELIAGAVISNRSGKPRLELIATGNQVKLSPGKNGTLVVQEAMFADGDDACCPSGLSVQVYRLHDGRFEPGQRFTRLNGET